ncbi:Uncharacterized protein TCM_040572 [Theobroma cacao]|uniref:Integrase catalytic domain-containing protein n=1 Tax=Theobroma cacao TaxID=3641 RepID=A0A061GTU0_THECC|nr:Uncharacterized protein TCM_040572 [Theobroma cacao]
MSTSTPNITHQPPPLFDDVNYSVWAIKMKAYLRGYNLWNMVENDIEISTLKDNASAAQVKQYEEDVAKHYKAMSFLHSAVSETIFSRIMGCETAKETWDTLMLGEKLFETSVVQKILISILEKFEATIASLEQSKDPIKLTITEIVSALQAVEQRRIALQNPSAETAFVTKHRGKAVTDSGNKKNFRDKDKNAFNSSQIANRKGKFKVCMYCKKCSHFEDNCWFKPDAKCKVCNELGHIDKVCKNKSSGTEKADQSTEKAQVAEETLFMALTAPNSDVHNDQWLLDSGSSNHITPLESMFVDLDKNYKSKVKIGNKFHLDAIGKGTVSIYASAGISVCQLGKLSRKLFPISTSRAKGKLDLVHFDVAGPMTKVELESGVKIKCLRTDNGGEYTFGEFTHYLSSEGINHQLTAYTPQQNGGEECLSRLRSGCHGPDGEFWVVIDMTPFETWFGHKPSLNHLRVFGWKWEPESEDNNRFSAASINPESIFQEDNDVLESSDNHNIDDVPVRGTRSIDDIYHRSLFVAEEPTTFAEATKCLEWRAAMCEELDMISKNQTWSLVKRQSNHHVIGVKWIFQRKLNPDGSVNKFKARLVAKGFSQRLGIDYMETSALVARFDTIRLLLALSSAFCWNPAGFIQNPNEDKVFKLHKALYGLKQAPRTCSSTKPSMIVLLYVDDLPVTGGDNIALQRFKEKTHNEFDMTDLGLMSYFLGLEINQSADGIKLSQKKYISDVLKGFHMEHCKPAVTPLPIHASTNKSSSNSCKTCFEIFESHLESCDSFHQNYSSNGPFSWNSYKQTLVAQSSVEAKYIAASAASNQAIWLRKVLADLRLSQCHPTPLLVDNKSAIAI